MAAVQLKRCRVVRRCSIDKQLNPYILHQLEKYIHDRGADLKRRASVPKGDRGLSTVASPANGGTAPVGSPPHAPPHGGGAQLSTARSPPEDGRKSSTTKPPANNGTVAVVSPPYPPPPEHHPTPSPLHADHGVGVLDPTTNTLVALYPTVAIAARALRIMFRDIGQTVRPFDDAYMATIFGRCLENATSTIFGYRWLRFDDVGAGNLAERCSVNYRAREFGNGAPGSYAVVHRVCAVSGVALASFGTVAAAFRDWVAVSRCSDVGTFKNSYIHGNCRVLNCSWKSELPGAGFTNPFIGANCVVPPSGGVGRACVSGLGRNGVSVADRGGTGGHRVCIDAVHAAGGRGNLAVAYNGGETGIKPYDYAPGPRGAPTSVQTKGSAAGGHSNFAIAPGGDQNRPFNGVETSIKPYNYPLSPRGMVSVAPTSIQNKGPAAENNGRGVPRVYIDAMHAAGNHGNLAIAPGGDPNRPFNGGETSIKLYNYPPSPQGTPTSSQTKGPAAENNGRVPRVYIDAMHAADNHNNLAVASGGDPNRPFNGGETSIKPYNYPPSPQGTAPVDPTSRAAPRLFALPMFLYPVPL